MVDDGTLHQWMESAVAIARIGCAKGESPFGALIVACDGEIIAAEHNRVSSSLHPSAHAEVLAIEAACAKIGHLDLSEYWLLATGEPCPMCAATAAMAGIARIGYGASEKIIDEVGYKTLGLSVGKFFDLLNYKINIRSGICRDECEELLRDFPNQ